MSKENFTDHELLAWASSILAEQQAKKKTGIVRVHVMQGP